MIANLNLFCTDKVSEFCSVFLEESFLLIVTDYRSGSIADASQFIATLEKLLAYVTDKRIVFVGDFNIKKLYRAKISDAKKTAYDSYIANSKNQVQRVWKIVNYEQSSVMSHQLLCRFTAIISLHLLCYLTHGWKKVSFPQNLKLDVLISRLQKRRQGYDKKS